MPRHSENLTRHNILLKQGDLDWIHATYPGLAAGLVIRLLIERHRRALRAKRTDPHQDNERILG